MIMQTNIVPHQMSAMAPAIETTSGVIAKLKRTYFLDIANLEAEEVGDLTSCPSCSWSTPIVTSNDGKVHHCLRSLINRRDKIRKPCVSILPWKQHTA